MRPIFMSILCLIVVSTKAQQYRIVADTVFIQDTIKYVRGQYVYLNEGTADNKSFNYIFTNPASLAGYIKIGSGYAFTHLRIKDFQEYSSKKLGSRVYLKLAGGNLVNYYCDVYPALRSGEIEANSHEKQ